MKGWTTSYHEENRTITKNNVCRTLRRYVLQYFHDVRERLMTRRRWTRLIYNVAANRSVFEL